MFGHEIHERRSVAVQEFGAEFHLFTLHERVILLHTSGQFTIKPHTAHQTTLLHTGPIKMLGYRVRWVCIPANVVGCLHDDKVAHSVNVYQVPRGRQPRNSRPNNNNIILLHYRVPESGWRGVEER